MHDSHLIDLMSFDCREYIIMINAIMKWIEPGNANVETFRLCVRLTANDEVKIAKCGVLPPAASELRRVFSSDHSHRKS